ncbi:hypothetical protein K2173_017478 [Erythroxylum novogranatense]|uniref:RING-type E3 ubiquitin transferase n=1 Tax=Erythroxylum novogranatense TaxID=1862640 RepID=A0AAV8TMX3_9ROSI|nr:hypothetical protein K2173_017478 [Erythroxylum novogranatense]
MDWVFFQNKEITSLSPSQQPYLLSQPPPQTKLDSDGFNFSNKVSPSILLIIIILAIIFFISGLLHLLVRFLLRPPIRNPDDMDNETALQGQLQQLFHLHDAGVDQSFIDTLPVFQYKAIMGLKNPFDCAVCLCEFEPDDNLRLLPKCSHAFHTECIDTWLLSHSTCPLCRGSLVPDFSPKNDCSPIVLVLESGSESSREFINDREANVGRTNSVLRTNSHDGCHRDGELGSSRMEHSRKSCEILAKDDPIPLTVVDTRETVVPVKLGKYRNMDSREGSGIGIGIGNNNVDSRRCYSMGSFEYVLDENSSLQVPIRTPVKKQSSKKPSLPSTPGHGLAMSECDCESRREFLGFQGIRVVESRTDAGSGSNAIDSHRSKRESFSISKIWLRGKKENQQSLEVTSRRALSFRFPENKNIIGDDSKATNGNADTFQMGICRWQNESGDEENQGCNSLESQPKTPTFARRSLFWLVGRQSKVVQSPKV